MPHPELPDYPITQCRPDAVLGLQLPVGHVRAIFLEVGAVVRRRLGQGAMPHTGKAATESPASGNISDRSFPPRDPATIYLPCREESPIAGSALRPAHSMSWFPRVALSGSQGKVDHWPRACIILLKASGPNVIWTRRGWRGASQTW